MVENKVSKKSLFKKPVKLERFPSKVDECSTPSAGAGTLAMSFFVFKKSLFSGFPAGRVKIGWCQQLQQQLLRVSTAGVYGAFVNLPGEAFQFDGFFGKETFFQPHFQRIDFLVTGNLFLMKLIAGYIHFG